MQWTPEKQNINDGIARWLCVYGFVFSVGKMNGKRKKKWRKLLKCNPAREPPLHNLVKYLFFGCGEEGAFVLQLFSYVGDC